MQKITKAVKNAAGAVRRVTVAVAQGSKVFVGEKLTAQRVSICERCPNFVAKRRQCALCGCFVAVKAKLSTEKCPDNRWPLTNV